MGAYSAAAPWLLSNGLAHNTNLASDPNADGVNLLLAYAFKLDPQRNLSGSMPLPVITGNQMVFSFQTGVEGVTYTVQRSSDLKKWSTDGLILTGPNSDGVITATIQMTEPSIMMRVAVAY